MGLPDDEPTAEDLSLLGQDGELPTVAVLLSTYNGSMYLEELLDSVLLQRGVAIQLIVRDDGSIDETPDILCKYAKANENMVFIQGSNIGVISSFNELMSRSEVDMCDFVAFCDQDDVWMEDKLSVAIGMLQGLEDSDMPTMYCSNLTVVDESLNTKRDMRPQGLVPTKESVLVQNIGTGCTEVFNQKARELYLLGVGSAMEMHDYWMTLVCMFMGHVIYDNDSHILYRQHGGNVVGARKKRLYTALQNVIQTKNSCRIRMLEDFQSIYSKYIDENSMHTISALQNSCDNWFARCKVLFSRKYISFNLKVTIGFKIRVAIGRVY